MVLGWAVPNGIHFDLGEYKAVYFRKPYDRGKAPTCMPNIPSLTVEDNLVNEDNCIRILGVFVTSRLKWNLYVNTIVQKVNRKMKHSRRLSGFVHGPNVYDLKRFCITSVRHIIKYACASWFLTRNIKVKSFNFPKGSLKRLQMLQNKCLVQISGAYHVTPIQMVHKELGINTIGISL
ncbi:putative RNA-directed DNA polymerase from transposon X-element [Colletotrichum sp. SAR 10_70]|nr:putative RNA-directed DNA polymerase from transposon X-element [Colletotrichum sp. SAR 10_71]KAI8173772.1 putative RNA-directed DNA polymerase from transposon X-element [Colletotrichum sp. SAR 10_70]